WSRRARYRRGSRRFVMKLRLIATILTAALLCSCKTGLIDRLTGENVANEIREIGSPAPARVLKIWDTGITLNGNPVVGLRLRVRASGIEPFEADTRALISRLDTSRIQPGSELAVKYDPSD